MKYMNMNKWTRTYKAEADDGSDGSSGDDTNNDDTTGDDAGGDDNDNSGGDDASKGIKLGDDKDSSEQEDAPESYADFELPEGMELDQGTLDKALPLFKEANLSQAMAQKFVDMRSESVKEATEAMSNQHVDQVNKWEADLKADTDIGGDKLPETLANAKLALNKVGTPELTKYLDDSGLSNNPELIRMFSKMGALMKEDNPDSSNSNSGNRNQSPEAKRAGVLYD